MQQNQPPSKGSADTEVDLDRSAPATVGEADRAGAEPRHELFEADGVEPSDAPSEAEEPRSELFQAGKA